MLTSTGNLEVCSTVKNVHYLIYVFEMLTSTSNLEVCSTVKNITLLDTCV